MIIKKYENFYKDNGLKVVFDDDNIPIINGIDCMCDNPKECSYSCHSGIPCKLFKPNERFLKWKENGTKPIDIDWDKEYIKIKTTTELELRMEVLEAKIKTLEEVKK